MPEFKNAKDLERYMERALKSALENEVAKDASNKMKEAYERDVYSYSYNEEFRQRRMSLIDDTNIQTTMVDNNTLSIENTAEPDKSVLGDPISQGTQLASWIEMGDPPNIFNERDDYPWTKPNPVTEHIVDEMIKSGSTLAALQRGLKRNGVDVSNNEIFLDIKVQNPRK